MKKRIHTILIFLAAVALCTGCSNEIESDIPGSGQAIDFACGILQSRAEETTFETIESFRVSAVWVKNGSEQLTLMDGQFVEKRENQWTYSPVMYMPTYGTVDFFAYSPAQTSVSNFKIDENNNNEVSFTYKVNTDPFKQHDFMVAEAVGQTSTPVRLDFQHMLSSVKVEAQSTSADYSFLVWKVALTDIYSEGILTGTTSGNPKNTVWTWGSLSDSDEEYVVYESSGSPILIGPTPTPVSDPRLGSFMLLPQTLTGDVKVTYSTVNNSTGVVESSTNELTFSLGDTQLDRNRKYTFCLQLSHGGTRSSIPASSASLEVITE
ncbi:hypothetical protein D0T51_10580 [Parabacteroides sp. 52]|uniref:fimbrillin family protein n=1 Tax=unclassified Parabacteroides TaxID=2649774 RepID=UPI0013D46CD7|nr:MULTISPECIES: fimbrillin family protein [unclassified Parabacteroides]MDH6535549.1 hypothetical protein [Parabacteroides sp. PM5-20]NDV56170.1 hypothetical protein [Parabacteroides sp. 52]